jgi:succinate-semialdehyde dehydrogenase/glutarate-semialdehyde dehydrogenase
MTPVIASSGEARGLAWIAGEWVEGEGGASFEVSSPSDGRSLGLAADCSAAQAEAAVASCEAALPGWRALAAHERADYLHRFADLMKRDRERLAALMTAEQGKPLAEARGEVDYAAGFLSWSAEEGRRINGETLPAPAAHKRIFVLRQPVGVTAAITPWNFPMAMITRKLGPALAAGCTQVVKPAEQTPLCAVALAQLAAEAGLPPGVFNLITASDPEPIGDVFCRDARVRKISFTGSTEVGRILVAKSAGNLARLSLELGGHAPVLVFDDANLDRAVEGIIASKFRNAGQTCVCVNRIYAQESIAGALVDSLQERIEALVVGPGELEGSEIGPLIDDGAVSKVEAHVADALRRGATLVCGGHARSELGPRYYAPTLLCGVDPEARIMREETFGPVAPVSTFADEQEALRLANDTPYGLAAYFFTRDGARILRVAEGLDYGIVGANDGRPSAIMAPFGGMKASGRGREGGKYGVQAYLESKYLSWALDS